MLPSSPPTCRSHGALSSRPRRSGGAPGPTGGRSPPCPWSGVWSSLSSSSFVGAGPEYRRAGDPSTPPGAGRGPSDRGHARRCVQTPPTVSGLVPVPAVPGAQGPRTCGHPAQELAGVRAQGPRYTGQGSSSSTPSPRRGECPLRPWSSRGGVALKTPFGRPGFILGRLLWPGFIPGHWRRGMRRPISPGLLAPRLMGACPASELCSSPGRAAPHLHCRF